MLEVRFVEASRQASRALGVQWNSFGQNTLANIGNRLPADQLLLANSAAGKLTSPIAAAGVLGQTASPYGFLLGALNRGGLSVDVALNALEEKGLARSLAEPNLVALSGDTASFLAGGEFPIPVPGSLGTVTHRLQALRRRPRLHPDGAEGRPDQPQDRARGQPARHQHIRSRSPAPGSRCRR